MLRSAGVWSAVGFGLANSIMIEGSDGVIVIDTMEGAEVAAPVARAFREAAKGKPVKALIFTHNHADHVHGTLCCCRSPVGVSACVHATERRVAFVQAPRCLPATTNRTSMRTRGAFLCLHSYALSVLLTMRVAAAFWV